jgi:hypothetical protein
VNLPVQEILTHLDSWIRPPSHSRISQILEVRGSAGSWLWVFTNSRLRGLAGSRFRAIARSRLRGFESSGPQTTAHSRLLDFVSSLPLKTCITNFINLDVSRVTGFHEFPNTSPSGKRVDSDDPIPRTFQNFSKKVTLGTSEGTRVTRKHRNSRIEARSQNYYPPAPINRRLPLLNFFSLLFCFVANCSSLLRGNSSCVLAFVASNFLRTFLRYYFFLLTLVSSFHRTSVIYFANFVHERRLYFLLFVLLSNRWLESKVLQDPWRPKSLLQLAFQPN